MFRWLTLAAVLAPAVAHAECPTDVRDLPPIGLLGLLTDDPAGPSPTFAASLSAGGAVRADDENAMTDASNATGSLGGQVSGRRGNWNACLSADVLDVRNGSSHVSAVGQLPWLLVPLRMGVIADRDVRVPLASRPELYAGSVSRIVMTLSVSMLDFGMSEDGTTMRIALAPVRVEQGLTSQDAVLDRRTSNVGLSMITFGGTDPKGSGEVRAGGFELLTNEDRRAPIGTETNGFVKISGLGMTLDRERWGYDIDGGAIDMAGPVDPDHKSTVRGWYLADVRIKLDGTTVRAHLERSPFMTADNKPAYEDRATAQLSTKIASFDAQASVFAARAHRWESGERAARAGFSAQLSRDLGHGFDATLDGELVAMPRGSERAGLGEGGARALASLAWSTSYQRGGHAK